MEVDFSFVIEVIQRSNVRLSGMVACGQTAFRPRGKKGAGVLFTHPANGHGDPSPINKIESYSSGGFVVI
jgi:hypothetical protein